ncbi:MAG: hydrogenase maturation nickel metallochaperone HypA [Clostridia bacterium]|nr:hydrogenase maturation nickel metallochaperone HypA [Clostridia bacterium]
MHELGVLYQALKVVNRVATDNHISHIRHITLEVGDSSGYLPLCFEKLFPVAADGFPAIQGAQLRVCTVSGTSLQVKDIGY